MQSAKFLCSILLPLALVYTSCSKPPVLTMINPNHVVPRQIVAVEGSELGLTDVVWNAGGSGEKLANSSILSARYFQIPEDAEPGTHTVQLRNSSGVSATFVIDVQPISGTWPKPRIEDVTLNNFLINSDKTQITASLLIAVANVDAKAEVRINATLQTSYLFSAIPSSYFPVHPANTYFYPVYHYGQLLVPITQPPGTRLDIQIKNIDGRTDNFSYTLASDEVSLDSDGDGLPDQWEINGYKGPEGQILSLAGFGCDPHRKDILVETDWIAAAVPNAGIWNVIENVYLNAPILNPDGSQGIAIHIDRGQNGIFDKGGTVLASHTFIGMGPSPGMGGYVDFFDYKADKANFDPLRKEVFHYCIFGNAQVNSSSGLGEVWGNDFFVSFVNGISWGGVDAEVGTFVHELGHNLNLYHGGLGGLADANETFKVNQPSIMNYRYQFGGIPWNTCTIRPDALFTYSRGMYNIISEQIVNESVGICDDFGLDFDGDGTVSMSVKAINVNQGTNPPLDTDNTDVDLDYDEWGNIQLNFRLPGSNWGNY